MSGCIKRAVSVINSDIVAINAIQITVKLIIGNLSFTSAVITSPLTLIGAAIIQVSACLSRSASINFLLPTKFFIVL